jgi:uncharacterized tellurite resistance protein B-like protein
MVMNTHTLILPEDGLGFTAPAGPLLGDEGWAQLVGRTAAAMAGLQDDTIAWFCPLATGGEDEQASPMVGLILTPAETETDLSTTGLHPAGAQPVPEMAFPALVTHAGRVCRVWLDDEDGPICLYLHQDQPSAEVENLAVQSLEELGEVEPTDLPGLKLDFDAPDLTPSRTLGGDLPGEIGPEAQHLERLKIAFVWQFVYMVIQADGVIDEREASFLQALFPTDLLTGLNLVDDKGEFKEPAFTLAKTEALKVLPTALNMDDRVQILRTLQKAAWADGIVLPEETRVFRMARQLLDVPREALS